MITSVVGKLAELCWVVIKCTHFFSFVFLGRSWGKPSLRKCQIYWASNVRCRQYKCNKGCIFQILNIYFVPISNMQNAQYKLYVIFLHKCSEMNFCGLCVSAKYNLRQRCVVQPNAILLHTLAV